MWGFKWGVSGWIRVRRMKYECDDEERLVGIGKPASCFLFLLLLLLRSLCSWIRNSYMHAKAKVFHIFLLLLLFYFNLDFLLALLTFHSMYPVCSNIYLDFKTAGYSFFSLSPFFPIIFFYLCFFRVIFLHLNINANIYI